MLNIRCYFTLFKDLARPYVEVHQKYLVTGLELQAMLSIEDASPEALKRLLAKQAQLNAYTNDNLPKIKDDIATVSVTSDIDPNPAHLSRTTRLLVFMCQRLYSRDVNNSANKMPSTR
jgi:hypothetical protein